MVLNDLQLLLNVGKLQNCHETVSLHCKYSEVQVEQVWTYLGGGAVISKTEYEC